MKPLLLVYVELRDEELPSGRCACRWARLANACDAVPERNALERRLLVGGELSRRSADAFLLVDMLGIALRT